MFTEIDIFKFFIIIFSNTVTTKSVMYNSDPVKDRDNSVKSVNKDSQRYELLDVDINNVKATWQKYTRKLQNMLFLIITRFEKIFNTS